MACGILYIEYGNRLYLLHLNNKIIILYKGMLLIRCYLLLSLKNIPTCSVPKNSTNIKKGLAIL